MERFNPGHENVKMSHWGFWSLFVNGSNNMFSEGTNAGTNPRLSFLLLSLLLNDQSTLINSQYIYFYFFMITIDFPDSFEPYPETK